MPRSAARRALRRHAGPAIAALLALVILATVGLGRRPSASAPPPAPAPSASASASTSIPPETAAPAAIAPREPEPRADEKLDRRGRTAFAGGYLALTPDFASPDGVYDLVLHFHGNTELVLESLAHQRINAVFVPQNFGVGSGVYEARFAAAGAFTGVLDRVQAAMEKRGLRRAKLGRVALVAWSAGYGAVLHILTESALAERVDAVLLLDCLHIGRAPGKRRPAVEQIAPWERFARWAIDGRKLFTITHSDLAIDAFLSARDATDVLLGRVGVLRSADGEAAAIPDIPAVEGVLPKRHRVPLEPLTLASRGRFNVRGYAGAEPEHHILHLMEMASTALPDLAAWWQRPRDASP